MDGESYTDLGGQLASETERERGLRKIAEVKARLKAGECLTCGHSLPTWHDPETVCHYRTAPRGESCAACGPNESEND